MLKKVVLTHKKIKINQQTEEIRKECLIIANIIEYILINIKIELNLSLNSKLL
jgi:hypothetical protein